MRYYLVKMATSKNALTLQKKYEVLEMVKKNPLMSVCKLAGLFACGKSQIASIIKNKELILELYESNLPSETICSRKRSPTSEFADVNEALHKWYLLAASRNIYPVGSQLSGKAKEIAKHLGIPNFKVSNGWLDRWKKRYNVR